MSGYDQCECGHLRMHHRARSCLVYVPAVAPKDGKRSQAKGQVGHYNSSICACPGFRANGLRFVPPIGDQEQRKVREGTAEPTYEPVGDGE